MSDDRPRAPTYGPPITIPSAYSLGMVADNAWVEAHPDEPSVFWADLEEPEHELWQRIATKVAERIRHASEHSHALGNYLPPPRCRASGATSTPSTFAVAGTPTRPTLAPTTKATVGCRSSRELAAAALATSSEVSTTC
jgi:hypothetical protein